MTFSEKINASAGNQSLDQQDDNSKPKNKKRVMLDKVQCNYVVNETCWFSLVMRRLWQHLGTTPTVWLETVNLMQNMHNLTCKSIVCEDIICSSLNSADEQVAYEARRRFILLFSLADQITL